MFINKDYLKPIDIGSCKEPVFYSRRSKVYGNYLCIKEGLMLKAIIMPTKLINTEDTLFVNLIDELHELCTLEQSRMAKEGEEE